MKTHTAVFKAFDEIETILTDAGLVNGLSLKPDDIKTTKKIMFWPINVSSQDASNKEVFITFNVINASPSNYFGDGNIFSRKATVSLSIYSRKRNAKGLIDELNNIFKNNEWSFELDNPISYNATLDAYMFDFALSKEIFNGS